MARAIKKVKRGGGCLRGCLTAVVLFIVFIAGSMIYVSRDWRLDGTVLSNYRPTEEIAGIATANVLTDHGRATFYRTNPKLVEGETFRKYCFANGVEALGCTTGFKIFLLNIKDPKFADHKYAVAVHEMLHVAYRRLDSGEKNRLNAWLDAELAKRQNDVHLTEPIALLRKRKKTKEADIKSELHSKFGVEYSDLSPLLEEYYKKYFTDRQKVVELFKKGGFNSRLRRMEQLHSELSGLNSTLVNLRNQLNTYQSSGNQNGYNSLISQFNSLVGQYNSKARETQTIYGEIKQFYQYFNPGYQPPQENKQ